MQYRSTSRVGLTRNSAASIGARFRSSEASLRRRGNCISCGAPAPAMRWAVISSFLANRAFHAPPRAERSFTCGRCGLTWSETGLTPTQAGRLYAGYRGDDYFRQRHALEPWYSRALNDGIGAEAEMAGRRMVMLDMLHRCGVEPERLASVADHGGDRGQMLRDFGNASKKVYEISGVALEPGCIRIDSLEAERGRSDLALTCHVLEHVNDPRAALMETASLVRSGGWVFIELPYERWRGPWQPRWQRALLDAMVRRPRLLMLADFVCTAMRVKLGWLPPFGFNVVREHLQYFTVDAVKALMQACDLEVLGCERRGEVLLAVGRKPS